ncbi:conjugal transfer protein TraB [Streptomyces pseudovenezuelae]|uniref:conjugal transfer protein TraB n=1 Tax=Streptomyces pseudovenezuelae TaxID=67350 RepID=UPI002E80C325|nr:conjugal transfer protein TraB [Streptomyces pseudovenezuelae]WUA94462.1 conjugal transfer protein TraB [Streptomyces pseudovenezuelae]
MSSDNTPVPAPATPPADNTPVPASSGEGDRPTWGGVIYGILNFITLAARVAALAAAAALLKEQLHLLKARMHRNAQRARTLAGHLHQARADARFQAQSLEVAAAFERVAEASGEVANAADQMEMNAQFVKDAHQAAYGGIYEVRQASPYEQPKPGFTPASR